MADTRLQIETAITAINALTTTLFPNNTTKDITPSKLRQWCDGAATILATLNDSDLNVAEIYTKANLETKRAASGLTVNQLYFISDGTASNDKVIAIFASATNAFFTNAFNLTDGTFGTYASDVFTAQGLDDPAKLSVDGSNSMTGPFQENVGNTIPSAAIINLATATGNIVFISGSGGPVTSFGAFPNPGTEIELRFDDGGQTLVHSSAIKLPNDENILVAPFDRAAFRETSTGEWLCMWYTRQDGTALVAPPANGIINITREDFIALAGSYSPNALYRLVDATPGSLLLDPLAKTGAGPDYTFSFVTNETTVEQGTYYLGTTMTADDTFTATSGAGEYTPTATGILNVDSATGGITQYSIVGDRMTIGGIVTVAPTLPGLCTLSITLPFSTGDFVFKTDASGSVSTDDTGGVGNILRAMDGTQLLFISFTSSAGVSTDVYFTAVVKIIPV